MKYIGLNELSGTTNIQESENEFYIYYCEKGSCSFKSNEGLNVISLNESNNIDFVKMENLNKNLESKSLESTFIVNCDKVDENLAINNNTMIECNINNIFQYIIYYLLKDIFNNISYIYIYYIGKCKKNYGYIKDKSNYYSLSYSISGAQLAYVNKNANHSKDCNNNVGGLIQVNESGPIYLCLSNYQSVELSSTTSGNYFMELDGMDNNIFTNIDEDEYDIIPSGIIINISKNMYTFDSEIGKCYIR